MPLVADGALVAVALGCLAVTGALVGSLDGVVAGARVVHSILDVGCLDLAGLIAGDSSSLRALGQIGFAAS